MNKLQKWLLNLAKETMAREGAEDAAHDYDHLIRVMSLADTMQAHEGGSLSTIWAAVALHDLGQERERRQGGDHALIGANMAVQLLKHTRFLQEEIPVVQQAIRDHRLTGTAIPQSLEGRILYDADKIDCLGAIGIGRLYCITGRYNQKVYAPVPNDIIEPVEPQVVRKLRRRPDYSPSVEFQLLFGNMPERMTTATGRALARERYDYMKDFFVRLKKEVEGEWSQEGAASYSLIKFCS
ncbi:MAG: HD domain-containing protein [Ktedonobacteraceae bacterium]